jgi:hypothetical protein
MAPRSLVRYAGVLVSGLIAGWRLVGAIANWRQWRRWAATDPSAAELYQINLWFDLAAAAFAAAIAALLWYLLRPTPRG